MSDILGLAGIAAIVAAAFLLGLAPGFAVLGFALLFVGWRIAPHEE